MKKKILCLAMMAVMAVGASTTAYAADYQGDSSWLVEYDGEGLNSNFTSDNIQDQMRNVQPGDSIQLQVQIQNSNSRETDWYMSNEVLTTLEEGSTASGGAYEYRLWYVGSDGTENVIYDSSTVGGDEVVNGDEGLHQATDSLEDYFYLDRLANGESGTVYLRVAVEGETQGNSYQETLARLQMNFAVEEVAEGGTTTRTVTRTETVRTGDTAPVLFFSILALISGLVLFGAALYTMKNRKNRAGKGE